VSNSYRECFDLKGARYAGGLDLKLLLDVTRGSQLVVEFLRTSVAFEDGDSQGPEYESCAKSFCRSVAGFILVHSTSPPKINDQQRRLNKVVNIIYARANDPSANQRA
jgi:hypothetical protein